MPEAHPVPVLYTDAGAESREAEAVLRAADIDFQVLLIRNPSSEGVSVPQLLSTQGFFDTLADIRWYARVYGSKARTGNECIETLRARASSAG